MQFVPSPEEMPLEGSRPRVGLCSVTLRGHKPQEVIELAAQAGLDSIEWGSDVHVPAGDSALAALIGAQTRAAGLTVSSYGSYFRFPWSKPPGEEADAVIGSALALGAPRIRVWAGPTGSGQTDPHERRMITESLQAFCTKSAKAGLETSVEFHLGTLADTAESTLQLLHDLGDEVTTYWQPRIGATDEEALEDLQHLGSKVSTVHVFSWGSKFDRHLLDTRAEMWRNAVRLTVQLPSVTDLLLEFLPNDDASLLPSEARQLKTWLEDAMERSAA
ncbi:TIM barrel protein [Arthrobacter sp. NQ7]|uniref:sugar phosphate isomerase/epimerase family protein n=1 Tax=Arthrobacter sp. NQ7 TaxID=3032303 RepID=UPI00240ED4B1|nr:TIM barrel protein [Arthrobacter sp. NQ7]MDJ0458624.1 TIM barrel protein [Arthrobacter sp. NQ7]